MRRGEVWTLRDDGYASKALPVVVVQSDAESAFDSVVLCLLTTFESSWIATRVAITPDETNGLKKNSFVMAEKLVTVDKRALGEKIGVLTGEQMRQRAGFPALYTVAAIRSRTISPMIWAGVLWAASARL